MDELIRNEVRRWDGLYLGLLRPDEREVVDEAVKRHIAYIDYDTPAGFFLAAGKVRLLKR